MNTYAIYGDHLHLLDGSKNFSCLIQEKQTKPSTVLSMVMLYVSNKNLTQHHFRVLTAIVYLISGCPRFCPECKSISVPKLANTLHLVKTEVVGIADSHLIFI